MKAINRMLVCLCVIGFSGLIFYSPQQLYDLITQTPAYDFSIDWPVARILTEPFYAFALYALNLDRNFYRPALISWGVWILIAVFTYCVINKTTALYCFKRILYAFMLFATVLLFTVLIPLPGPKLIKPEGYVAADIHSHTMVSHDATGSAASNLKFHELQGFDFFFITEHNHTKGFLKFPENERYKKVFPGVQMQTKDGVSVLLLSGQEFDGNEYKNITLSEIIEKAHQNSMLVIMPHWWKWHKFSYQELTELGIDGFEVYNCGYRYFDAKEQSELISFCKENNLLMFGTTDWHGWGYMTDVWTVFKGDAEQNLKDQLAKKPDLKVITFREKQWNSPARFIFEPFAAYYYYVKNADMTALLSFMAWFGILFTLMSSNAAKYIKSYLPAALSLFFLGAAIYYYVISIQALETNRIILTSVVPVLTGMSLLWFALWRMNGKDFQ
ncbi:MAG: hypothetical protein FWD54_06280 [Endomicrobia bacterium]|nr:hypothetical protein [Endomicrobiia bacterium]MCL2799863.1 hypothetical protein [Endomicrobiia bacterium]